MKKHKLARATNLVLPIALMFILFSGQAVFAAATEHSQDTTVQASPDVTPGSPGGTVLPEAGTPGQTTGGTSRDIPPSVISEAAQLPELTGPEIRSIEIIGNKEVVAQHILSVITSKAGEPVDEEKLRQDAEAIYELGFFVATDYSVTDVEDGVNVVFAVQENPVVGEITFTGNTVYSSKQLQDLIFTKPGMIFNRTFFRNDLQRIKEKYQEDGYVMANVQDVQIQGNIINVVIVEPKIAQIVVQGNKITKTHIIRRYIKLKEGDQFNSNKLRLSLNRLQGLGFFNDVNVNFEPADNPDDVILVLTVEEGRTGKLGFNVSYGTQSGFGGGLSYENSNIGGNAHRLTLGFDLGNRKEYWATYEQPYMSGKVMAWKVGVYKQAWNNLYYYYGGKDIFEYDRDKTGAYFGFGKKFAEESMYNWYVMLDWHKVSNTPNKNISTISGLSSADIDAIQNDLGDGTYYSVTTSFRRYNVDEYLPYTKGDVETVNFQFGKADVRNKDYNFVKYWLETRFYVPVDKFLRDFFETSFGANKDKPMMLAARVIGGMSTGDVPYEELYTMGGDTTLRGYKDEEFRGDKMVLANIELRIPLDKAFGIVFLYDIGRTWYGGAGVGSYASGEWEYSYGFGVRLNTPLGNIRLDYAKGRNDDRFHFGFGELF